MSSLYASAGAIRNLHKTVVEIKKMLATALEGGAGHKATCCGGVCTCTNPAPTSATVDGYPINKDAQDAPTPATVERYTIYGRGKYRGRGSDGIMRDGWMEMKPIGTVVATPSDNGYWVKYPGCPVEDGIFFLRDEYRALVDMMLKSGVWERNNG